jgi:hypothetical protein
MSPRMLYVCQKCGDEVGEGEQDHRGRHPICGGTLDPVGECLDYDEQVIRVSPSAAPQNEDADIRAETAIEQLRDENR